VLRKVSDFLFAHVEEPDIEVRARVCVRVRVRASEGLQTAWSSRRRGPMMALHAGELLLRTRVWYGYHDCRSKPSWGSCWTKTRETAFICQSAARQRSSAATSCFNRAFPRCAPPSARVHIAHTHPRRVRCMRAPCPRSHSSLHAHAHAQELFKLFNEKLNERYRAALRPEYRVRASLSALCAHDSLCRACPVCVCVCVKGVCLCSTNMSSALFV
jgi:hypothetical protein